MRSLVADSDIRRLWLSGALAGTLRWLETLATGIFTLHLTSSGTWVSVSLLLRLVPMVLFGTLVGTLTAKMRPQTILIAASGALVISYLAAAFVAYTASVPLGAVLAVAFISGCHQVVEIPVRRTLLAELAGSSRMAAAITLDLSTANATRMLGPIMGGFYYGTLGIAFVYLIGALGITIAAFLIWKCSLARSMSEKRRPSLSPRFAPAFGMTAILRHVHRTSLVQAILGCTVAVNLFGVCYLAVIPVLGKEILHLSSMEVGILQSMEGAGALIGTMGIGALASYMGYRLIFYAGSVLYVTAILSLAFSSGFLNAAIAIFIGGLGAAGFSTMQSTLLLQHTPAHLRHHVMGVLQLCIGSGIAGLLLIGLLVDAYSARIAVASTSAAGLVFLGLAGIYWPSLWRTR